MTDPQPPVEEEGPPPELLGDRLDAALADDANVIELEHEDNLLVDATTADGDDVPDASDGVDQDPAPAPGAPTGLEAAG